MTDSLRPERDTQRERGNENRKARKIRNGKPMLRTDLFVPGSRAFARLNCISIRLPGNGPA